MSKSLQFGRWQRKTDKVPVTRINVCLVLDGEQLALTLALASSLQEDPIGWLGKVGRIEATQEIRSHLAYKGTDSLDWAFDGWDDSEADPLREAATGAVRRLWPEAFEGGE